MLVIFEGLDGLGKSTLVNKISDYIPGCVVTKEPGSSLVPLNSQIREIVLNNKELNPLERELMFYVDASQHKKMTDKMTDKFILSDRGLLSHLAYLRAYLKIKAIDFDQYTLCKKLIDQCCAKPDLIIYLKGSIELMKLRKKDSTKDAIESNGTLFYQHVLETYTDLTENEWASKTLVLNANDSIDSNVTRVLSYLQEEGSEILFKKLRD